MTKFAAALLFATMLTPVAAPAQTPPPAATAPVSVEPIAYTERTLANGLRVYAIRDTTTSTVSVQVWYDVGSKDDPAGKSGFAHMFEHLMFKGTRNLVDEQVDRLTEDVGGYNNASTGDDYTNYFEAVPANHLQRLLFAEADRMATLVVDPKVFASEREVVKEELRSRVLAAPFGKLFYLYRPMIGYTTHPYARPGIGSIEDLDAATIDDIRAFHATYYRPDNAVLVVAGNFDPAQLDQWVDQYFAGIKKPARPIPRVTATEPEPTKARAYTVYEPNTPLPAVLINYPLPPSNHPDAAALTVLNTIMAGGDNSRLYQSLVYRDQLAAQAASFYDAKQSTGQFSVYAILAGGKTAVDGEAALRREIARLRDEPVTAAELAEAKNELLTENIEGRETAEGKAFTLANAIIVDRDPRAADKRLAELATVTAADVQRVARRYLTDARSSSIRYNPAESAPAGSKGDTITLAPTVQVAELKAPADIVIHTAAAAGERVAPPEPGAPVKPVLPQPTETRLANGMRVIVVEKRGLPLVSAALMVEGGGALDPSGRAGLASMTASLLTKGTTTRSATQIAEAVESLGGSIASDAQWDGAGVTLTVKSDQLTPALGILADVARNPALASEELDRARTQAIDGVTVQLKDPGALSRIVATRAVFGDAAYGNRLGGTPASLKAITRDEVMAAYRASWRPERAALVLVGDIDAAGGQKLAEQLFGDWRGQGQAAARAAAAPAVPQPRVIVVDLPDAGQAGVVVARPGIARSDPRFYAANVANATLGVGFSSRLNQEIRIKRGLAYGAGSQLDARRGVGPVSAATQTKNPTAPDVVAIIAAEMRRLGTEPAPAAELATRKAVLIGSFGRATETRSGIAGLVGDYVVEAVPLAELQRYGSATEAVDPRAVQAAAAALLDPAAASIVVVGDAKQFIEPLRKAYPQVEVIAAGALNLDRAALQ
ncbi:insulinase family protein [Sphingomonas sp. S1-29]|uniref:M16 family metallopeptidase n=1 Tax=Sphingomonas sp. S1-29 TaxID=2991074 RepID=UPI00223F5B29|nr:pitrilysin family protein [Sphingomonas sp. S1-29]UZK69251.1 insulinase family protein [Sphingomonas sp. S1-29]